MQIPEKIILVSAASSKRLEYTIRFISSGIGIDIGIIPASDFKRDLINQDHVILHYGNNPVEGEFNIFSSGLLYETGIRIQASVIFRNQSGPMLFPAPQGFDLPFDIFSASFYLLSRYEEYLPFKPDSHGRFEAEQSLACLHGFLDEPVIDQWIMLMKNTIRHRYSGLVFPVQKFRYVSTIDVDNPWAYRHKSLFRTAGGMLKSMLNFQTEDLRMRLKVLGGKLPDPYDTYSYIKGLEENYGFRSLFFFLLGNYGKYDTNFSLKTRYFKQLVFDHDTNRSVGIHPSFKSNFDSGLLESEFACFSKIMGHKPEISRQHFLVVNFPETYHKIISLGIHEDYSMGYASKAGFRAGTSNPFHFYDLASEQETGLVVIPFAIMDVTLRQYMLLSPEEALERIKQIASRVKKVNGTFTSLWHNESLSEYGVWKGWRRVFEGMVREVTSTE